MNKKFYFLLLLIFIIGSILFKIITLPPFVKHPKLIEIPENSNALQIANILKKENIIKSIDWFIFWTNYYKVQNKLQAGIYEFKGRTPLKKVIEKLVKGQISLISITVPEGSTCTEIGKILERKKIVSCEEFEKYAKTKKLEGYLFPDTYFFPLNVSMETVINMMYANFKQKMKEIYGEEEFLKKKPNEIKKIITIASIIEKEANVDSERPIVASVIYNRLRKNLPLQSCATVEYALGYHKPKLYDKDLKIKSPYNTYIYKGLPPTPICNPGKKSIEAAIYPAKTNYLYFVSKGDGTNYFSSTSKEHLEAKEKYQINTSNISPH